MAKFLLDVDDEHIDIIELRDAILELLEEDLPHAISGDIDYIRITKLDDSHGA